MWLVNIPVVIIWLTNALLARKLFYFSAINPALKTGGMLGASKYGILQLIPTTYLPKTLLVPHSDAEQAFEMLRESGIGLPCIAKPDVGERGYQVAKIDSEQVLSDYLRSTGVDIILQEYIDLPVEISILCYQLPGADKGEITSVCIKEFLHVVGDGQSTVEELILQKPRAILQLKALSDKLGSALQSIPRSNEVVPLEPIGNHSRGTKFLNGNHLIDDRLTAAIVGILSQMKGIQYGRFDLRTRSIEDLKNGAHIKVLEFNGVASEPAHIYDPDYPTWKGYADVWKHWAIMRRIHAMQKTRGIEAMGWKEAMRSLADYRSVIRAAKMPAPTQS